VAARSKAWVCGRSFAGIAGSNPADDIDVRLLRVFRFVKYRSLRRANPTSRESYLSVCVCMCVCH
jgi:hypothetical protein